MLFILYINITRGAGIAFWLERRARDRKVASSNPGISLLPVISKPLERHIHKHLLQYLENNKLIHQYQSGFRPDHSCHTALTRLCDGWLSAINSSQIVGTVFLDFKKAFDRVDHSILLKKL